MPPIVRSPSPIDVSLSSEQSLHEHPQCQWKGLVLTLIRHAESTANISSIKDVGINSPLSSDGVIQAKKLAETWSNTRIDHLLSSFLNRAVDTAQAIADAQNSKRTKNDKSPGSKNTKTDAVDSDLDSESISESDHFLSVLPIALLREALIRKDMDELEDTRKDGERCDDDEEAEPLMQNDPMGQPETLQQVSARAYMFLSTTIDTFGVTTPQGDQDKNKDADSSSQTPSLHPDEIDLKSEWMQGQPDVLPPGLPHVVAVGHNVFFCELYEQMSWWNFDERHGPPSEAKEAKKKSRSVHWHNADWSRHIVWVRRPRPDSTGWELKFEDLRLPD